MKVLHTSDWHVGATIRGRSRADEHRAVLAEIGEIAASEQVDLVVVAGDLFETAAPGPESEAVVYDAFLQLSEVAPVVAVAGNHDNPRRLDAVSPLLRLGRVTMLAEPRGPNAGGVVEQEINGTPVRIALVPFISQRAIVRVDHLMADAAFENAQVYAERLARIVESLTSGFTADAVNLIVAHAFVQGGSAGGGERGAHLVEEYSVPASAFPATANYVALGHLHRPQVVRGTTAIHYCGSPLQLDFGEEAQPKQVNVVSVEPGLPAKVDAVPLHSGRALRTVRGTIAQLESLASTVGDAWLRARVDEPARVGLADEVRAALGDNVVDVMVDHDDGRSTPRRRRRDGRAPEELFADFLADREIEDPRLLARFSSVLEDVHSGVDMDSGRER